MFHSKSEKTHRPDDSAFKQQRLPAWQPIITASSALPVFFGIGIFFIPIGIGIVVTSDKVHEIVIDYTNCKDTSLNGECSDIIQKDIYTNCYCTLNLTLPNDLKGDVFFYYGLKNYFQNLRRYVSSRDDNQLLGLTNPPASDCNPYWHPEHNKSVYYAPCGAIANSMFNDSFELYYKSKDTVVKVPWLNTGIAWPTDVRYKFNNPPSFNGTIRPPYWRKNVNELDPSNENNNGYKNEDFIVWMRTAAMPRFRKLYRRLNKEFENGSLPAGDYYIRITYNYPVKQFHGRKQFIISTTSWLGGKNSFMGYAYIAVGILCIITGLAFLALHLLYGNRLTDPKERTESVSL